MAQDTLALVLAAGKGERVKHLLDEEHPVKAMLIVNEVSLLEKIIESVSMRDTEKAVLSYDAPEFRTMENLARMRGTRVLHQKAKRRKLPLHAGIAVCPAPAVSSLSRCTVSPIFQVHSYCAM